MLSMLVLCLVNKCCGSFLNPQTLEGLAAILPALLNPSTEDPAAVSADDASEDEDGEEGDALSRALMHLFEVSLDLLSLSTDQAQATRGLRDGVKKAWQAVCALHGASLSVDVIDSIVSAVIGEEHRADDDGEDQDGSDAEGGESDGEMDVDEPVQAASTAKKGNKGSKQATRADSEEEEEDIVISDEKAFDMLTEGVDEGKRTHYLRNWDRHLYHSGLDYCGLTVENCCLNLR